MAGRFMMPFVINVSIYSKSLPSSLIHSSTPPRRWHLNSTAGSTPSHRFTRVRPRLLSQTKVRVTLTASHVGLIGSPVVAQARAW